MTRKRKGRAKRERTMKTVIKSLSEKWILKIRLLKTQN